MSNDTPAITKWLLDCAEYFERRDTGGEDRAHWANVYNAENARKAAAALTASEARVKELEEALKPFVNLVAKNEDGELEDQLEGLPDGHAFNVFWRTDGCGDKSPWVSARHFHRARAALKGNEG